MSKAIVESNYSFPKQKSVYHGKVRDVYNIDDQLLVMVVSDRISAFDYVLPNGIPYKGQVLNQIAEHFLDASQHIVPNWKMATPDPMVTVGHFVEPFKVEMIVRGYLTGHAWREYKSGKRQLCGAPLAEDLKEHQRFEKPIITPTTKDEKDEDIEPQEIINRGLVSAEDYALLEKYSMELFELGTQMAAEKGLILVDTKYEFGKKDGTIYLIDEVHTPDSSRYFYADQYEARFAKGENQRQLSKEFVREWLMEQGFKGEIGQTPPVMPDNFVEQVSERYIELFEKITGKPFVKANAQNVAQRIETNVAQYLSKR